MYSARWATRQSRRGNSPLPATPPWCGPESPLFGKDRIATLESALIADKRPHHETKNPYFRLIHEPWFCEKILAKFGVDPEHGLIVNGHVPVEVEKGESPLKRSGKAITIDGAFSEAYGYHGFTLVMEPRRTFLAKHHHFESVEAAILHGADIIPSITVVREWDRAKSWLVTKNSLKQTRFFSSCASCKENICWILKTRRSPSTINRERSSCTKLLT